MDDPYKILGIDRTATAAQIKAAYRRQANANHPDKHADKNDIERNAYAQQFRRAQWAYDILKSAASRAHYDQHGVPLPPSPYDQTIVGCFSKILFDTPPSKVAHVDLVKSMRLALTDRLEETRMQIQRNKGVIHDLTPLLGRMVKSGARTNPITDYLQREIDQIEQQVAALVATEQHLKSSISELRHYRWITGYPEELETTTPALTS